MDSDQEPSAVRQLLSENQRLKQKVFELEEKARTSGPVATSTGQTSVLKLIEHKDFQLQQYSARLEEKKEQLEEASREIRLWKSAARLGQELAESDAAAVIGVDREGVIVLFNRNAPQILGEKFRDSLHRPIESVDFRAFDPDTARKVKEALAAGKAVESSVVVRDRRIQTVIQPVGKDPDDAGALVRIRVVSAK